MAKKVKHHPSLSILKEVFGKPVKELDKLIWLRETLTIKFCEDCKSITFLKKEDPTGLRVAYFEHENFNSRLQELLNWAVQ